MRKIILLFVVLLMNYFPVQGAESTAQDSPKRFQNIQHISEISSYRYDVYQQQAFDINLENFGRVRFVPAIDAIHKRVVIFLADTRGSIVYRTDNLECNARARKDTQEIEAIAAASFQDVNGDGLTDIILICRIAQKGGAQAEASYKVGDVLLQRNGGFYSDARISESINYFSMNQNIDTISAFVEGKQSKEFLYTAKTLDELVAKGFIIMQEHSFWTEFEAFGRVRVVPGTYAMGGLRTLMLYIFDSAGTVCARINAMKWYDDCTDVKGIAFQDVDGNGLKDIVVLAEYRSCDEGGFSSAHTDAYVSFQKDYWFERNLTFEKEFVLHSAADLFSFIEKAQTYFRK